MPLELPREIRYQTARVPGTRNPNPATSLAGQLLVFVVDVVRQLLASEKKEREEAEKKQQELEEQLNRYSAQYETTQQGLDASAT